MAMRYRVVLLIFVFFLLPATAQEDNLFVSNAETVAFFHPAAWSIQEDAATEIFISGDNLEIFLQIVGIAELPVFEVALTPSVILDHYFSDAGYGSPEVINLTDDREGAIIRAADEAIVSFFLDRETFLLAFITADEAIRDERGEAINTLLRSFQYGEGAVLLLTGDTDAPSGEVTAEPVAAGAGVTFAFGDGQLRVAIPEAWAGENVAELGYIVLDETFQLIIVQDVTLLFDLVGGGGDVSAMTTPQAVLNGLGLGADFPIRTFEAGRNRVASVDLSDEVGDYIVYVVQVDNQTVVPLLFYGEAGALFSVDHLIEAFIASMQYEA